MLRRLRSTPVDNVESPQNTIPTVEPVSQTALRSFRSSNGYTFSELPQPPVEVYVTGDLEHVYQGAVVTTDDGQRCRLVASRHAFDAVYVLLLLPITEEQ